MKPILGIHRSASLTIAIRGLAPADAEYLRQAFPQSDHPLLPFFRLVEPGIATLHGSDGQLRHAWRSLADGNQVPAAVREVFRSQLENYLRSDYELPVVGRTLHLSERTHLMGILNVTPDSFSDGGRFSNIDSAVSHARAMMRSGADIIDIGGESTRPGAEPLSEDEETARVLPVIQRIAGEPGVIISIDTYKAAVAKKALDAGAAIVNDISGLRFSPDMATVAGDHGAAVVIMHIKGTPRDMQKAPVYDDLVGEITDSLAESIEIALKGGIKRNAIMVDPGIGFGKSQEHNLEILNRLDEFRVLGCPIVLGASRKRFIGGVLNIPVPEDRLFGTAATTAMGIVRGAHVLRVHDVEPMCHIARMTDAILRSGTA